MTTIETSALSIRRWLGRVLDVVPSPCLACGEATAGAAICAPCHSALPWNRCACPRCALPIAIEAAACGRCIRHPPLQSRTLAPLRYAEPVDHLLTTFKFGQQLSAGRLISSLIDQADGLTELLAGVTLALPIPLHRARLRERGYNQAWELFRPLMARRQIAVSCDALLRQRSTLAQTGLDAPARRRNLRKAFTADATQINGQRVLLMDDVVTTGATIAEASRTLLRAGASEVRVLAAARVARG